MEVQTVTIELARPRGNFPGRVAVGHYTVNDGTVMLVDKDGVPVDRVRFARKLKPDEDARAVACVLTRQRHTNKSRDFNRPIHYPRGF